MNKKTTAVFLLLAMVLSFPFATIAKTNDTLNDSSIPEVSGVYDVPGHPNLKVRVFVHYPKNDNKLAPAISSACTDDNGSAVVGATGWHLPSTWTYSLNPNSAPTAMLRSNLPTIANSAFSVWTTALNGKVTINRGADTTVSKASFDGKNIVAWGRTKGTALGVTYTWADSSGNVFETDTILNAKFPWSFGTCNASYYDVQDILTHELGHWMGMDDEYDAAYMNHTMYGYGSKGEIKKDTLTDGDIAGVNIIY